MPVRRYYSDNRAGYGSLGVTQLVPGSITRYLLWLEAQNINALTQPAIAAGLNPTRRIYTILHSWKFTAITWDFDRLQTYNAITGKAKFGTVILKNRGYVTGEMHVSFREQMSAPMITTVNFVGEESKETDIPCDEPPSDSPFIPVESDLFYACSGNSSLVQPPNSDIISATKLPPADEVIFYPEPALKSYIFGAGFRYNTFIVTAAALQSSPEPVVINQ